MAVVIEGKFNSTTHGPNRVGKDIGKPGKRFESHCKWGVSPQLQGQGGKQGGLQGRNCRHTIRVGLVNPLTRSRHLQSGWGEKTGGHNRNGFRFYCHTGERQKLRKGKRTNVASTPCMVGIVHKAGDGGGEKSP